MTVRPIRHLRWWIAGLVFVATVINYIDRQVFSILAPDLQERIGWSELDYGRMVVAFQLSYAVMMMVAGRVLDRVGTKLGFAVSVLAWSVVEVAHAFARTATGFGIARFALGLAEAPNFPAAVKTVAEWFPPSERALATGLFNSGVALGAIFAPLIVPFVAARYGWQTAFVLTGFIGLAWLPAWFMLYGDRATHPRLSAEERRFIEGEPESAGGLSTVRPNEAAQTPATTTGKLSLGRLLTLRQTWAYALLKCLGDPIWWFYLFWLPKFLATEHGIRGTAVVPYLTTVYIAADLGCLGSGYLASGFVGRGWSLNRARKTTMVMLALVMTPAVIVAAHLHAVWPVIILIAIACGCHQGWSTIVFTIASDLFPSRSAASVTGFGGFMAGIVSMLTAELTGRWLNANGNHYFPIFFIVGALYPVSLLVFHTLSPRMEPVGEP